MMLPFLWNVIYKKEAVSLVLVKSYFEVLSAGLILSIYRHTGEMFNAYDANFANNGYICIRSLTAATLSKSPLSPDETCGTVGRRDLRDGEPRKYMGL